MDRYPCLLELGYQQVLPRQEVGEMVIIARPIQVREGVYQQPFGATQTEAFYEKECFLAGHGHLDSTS
jgi:hypothetical protein